jgi:hypothetical protein
MSRVFPRLLLAFLDYLGAPARPKPMVRTQPLEATAA